MAASASTMNANQMERLTTCPICLDKFRIPKLLPCMHTFCLTPCLTSLVDPRARSLKCPECRREHTIPAGGVQAFPANLTMIGFLDLHPSNAIERADRCAICQQQKPTLVKCHDCSKFMCTECREPHLRETFYQISASVSQLRRTLPQLSEKIASYEQRVNAVRTQDELIRREIALAIATLMEELKHRETTLFTEAEVHLQSQLRMFRLQQEAAEVELASIASFCESIGTSLPNNQIVHDADLANLRSQCQRYAQQIDGLLAQMPTDVHKLRLIFENQQAMVASIQNFGRLIDTTRDQHPPISANQVYQLQQQQQQQQQQRQQQQRQQTRMPIGPYPGALAPYATDPPTPRYVPSAPQNDQYRNLENLYYSRGSAPTRQPVSMAQTFGYRPPQHPFSASVNYPISDLSQTVPTRTMNAPYSASWNMLSPRGSAAPPPPVQSTSIFGPNPFAANNPRPSAQGPTQAAAPAPPPALTGESSSSPRRNYVTSTTAGRSLEGDDRPIFGGRGGGAPNANAGTGTGDTILGRRRGRGAAAQPPNEPLAPPPNVLQRRGTFVLDEPSLPNLPQSGAQRPRDRVNVQELYNVRRRNRAQTPVAFTINLAEAAAATDTAGTDGTGTAATHTNNNNS